MTQYEICELCDSPACHDCLKDWAVQQVNGRYFKRIDRITIKCHQEKCTHSYPLTDLQNVFVNSRHNFVAVDDAVTMKLIRASEEYVSCPNKGCKGIGFMRPEMLCCKDDIECRECGLKWRLPGQRSRGDYLFRYVSSLFSKIYDTNTYSDLYKVLFAQMCPSCKVMIERSEGCKFMECGKCKYQFCWLCLSEFYTEYHYYYSNCPMRIVPIYGTIAIGLLFLLVKICYIFPIIGYYTLLILEVLFV